MSGTMYTGTSGFAYPDWAPRFYPPGSRGDSLLPLYAARLNACELNNTYYRQPTPERIRSWVQATPDTFRFTVKAQRGGSVRALMASPLETLAWLLGPLGAFGRRLGSVLYRVPEQVERNASRLDALLAAWPAGIPVTFEFQHASWHVDEIVERLQRAGASLCATDLDDRDEPPLRVTAPFLYLRLRRTAYSASDLEAWAARLAPFLDAGHDAFVFFRHDADGTSAERAAQMARAVERERASLRVRD